MGEKDFKIESLDVASISSTLVASNGHRGITPYYFKANINNDSASIGRKDLSTTSDVVIQWYSFAADNDSTSYFTCTAGDTEILIKKAGLYTFNYNIHWDNTVSGAGRATVYGSIWVNGENQRGVTKSYGYSRGNNYGDRNNCHLTYTERFAADDAIEIKCTGIDFDDASDACYTINDESSIQIYGWPDEGE